MSNPRRLKSRDFNYWTLTLPNASKIALGVKGLQNFYRQKWKQVIYV